MKVLVTANQKGGVGKTSTVVHLAFDFAERGKKVAVIDLDTQGNASFTLRPFATGLTASELWQDVPEKRLNQCLPSVNEGQIYLVESDQKLADVEKLDRDTIIGNFKANMAGLAQQGFDVCLIDTAPTLSVALIGALVSADYVLSPIEMEVYAIQGIKQMLKTVEQVRRRMNSSLKFIGMLPSKVDGRNPRHKVHLQELQNAYPQMMIPVSIGLRTSIGDALASNVPVWKIRKTAARLATREMRALAEHVYARMELV